MVMKNKVGLVAVVLCWYAPYIFGIQYDPMQFTSTNIKNNIKGFSKDYSLGFLSPYSWLIKLDKQEFEWPLELKTADDYAIHLMPKTKEDDVEILITLLNNLKFNKNNIRNSLKGLKFFDDVEFKKINANIVLYPKPGKENAQKIVDFVYSLFSRKKGTKKPLANAVAITPLIRYTNGGKGAVSDELRLRSPKLERKS